jgi:hypothetical protein
MTILTKYENRVFRPLEEVQIEDGTVVEVHVPQEGGRKPRSILELGVFGMWAGRDDITDSVSYVNVLRDLARPTVTKVVRGRHNSRCISMRWAQSYVQAGLQLMAY